MAFVRVAHPKDFDVNRSRFSDTLFKQSTGGGMSVFDADCAIAQSGTICEHCRAYYGDLTGDPPIFCIIEDSELPPGTVRTPSLSSTGDECHFELIAPSKNMMKNQFKAKRSIENFFICDPSGKRVLQIDDFPAATAL